MSIVRLNTTNEIIGKAVIKHQEGYVVELKNNITGWSKDNVSKTSKFYDKLKHGKTYWYFKDEEIKIENTEIKCI